MVLSLDPTTLSAQLDQLVALGIQVIKVFAPADGRYAYAGLDTVGHYRIDPELGTMDDFRRLVRIAHGKGLAVILFPNLGYFSIAAPDWLEACDDKRAGRDTPKVRWFMWSDRPDAPPPGPGDSVFYVDRLVPGGNTRERLKTWGWQPSERAGCYYWARWQGKEHGTSGQYVGLPATSWYLDEWPREAERIVRFWMDTGIDGMLIDAPLFYPGLTWEKNNRHISGVIASYGNVMIQPEGSRDVSWITEGRYNCLQDYGLSLWGGEWRQDSIERAIEIGDPRRIEESLRGYHDPVVAAGGILYQKVRRYDDAARRRLSTATIAAIGDLVVFLGDLGRQAPANPDPEETWVLQTKRLHPALHQLGSRRKLATSADDKHYAFLRTSRDGSERVLVVLSYQPTPESVLVDLSGVATSGLVELRQGELVERVGQLRVDLPAFGYRFYQVLPVASA
jgi:Alpha amylase, catalytic domain/Maltogenic Amylase, C-terminal domain